MNVFNASNGVTINHSVTPNPPLAHTTPLVVTVSEREWEALVELAQTRKPWHDAKQGEVWVVTRKKTYEWEEPTTVRSVTSSRKFSDVASLRPAFEVTDGTIIAAERIWPKDAA